MRRKLLTTHALTLLEPELHSTISVQNVTTTCEVGTDAWGRSSKSQPVLVNVCASLKTPFSSAAAGDTVDGSTIHYGVLSKGILEAVKSFTAGESLVELVAHVVWCLDTGGKSRKAILDSSKLSSLEVEISLPKASLMGVGVSVYTKLLYTPSSTGVKTEKREATDDNDEDDEDEEEEEEGPGFSTGLRLHKLRIPTLIGVNPNERLAKQMLVTSVEIDCYSHFDDHYVQLEELVVKTIEESSFETLESLAMHLARYIVRYFLIPTSQEDDPPSTFERVKVRFEKPTATTFADNPIVEFVLDSSPSNAVVKKLWAERESAESPPFPLQGRLDEWVKKTYPKGDAAML